MLNERGSRRIYERVRSCLRAVRQPRAGGFEDLPVGETTTGDNDADVVKGCGRHSCPDPRRGQHCPGSRRQHAAARDPRPEVRVALPRE